MTEPLVSVWFLDMQLLIIAYYSVCMKRELHGHRKKAVFRNNASSSITKIQVQNFRVSISEVFCADFY